MWNEMLSIYVPEFCDVYVDLLHEAERWLDASLGHEDVGHLVLELLVHVRLGQLEHQVALLRRRLQTLISSID